MRCLDRLDMTGLRGAFWPPLHGCHLEPPIVVISSLSRDLFLSVLFSLTPRKGPKEGCYPQGPLQRGMQTGVADDRRLPCLFGIAGHAIFSPTSLLSPSLGKGLTGPRRMFLSAGAGGQSSRHCHLDRSGEIPRQARDDKKRCLDRLDMTKENGRHDKALVLA